jgi:FMN phosphatase YigB (HAD superfamily)
MQPKSPIRLVCLDIGGVLVRICSGWADACRIAKIEPGPETFDAGLFKQIVEASHRLEHGHIDVPRFDREVAELTGLTPEQVGAAAEAWLLGVYEGAVELIDWLNMLPAVGSACLSNTTTRHWEMMTTPGRVYAGLDRLKHQFVSYNIGHMKPAPEIYRHVERVTGLRPQEIIFFDDSVANVEGARACGWHAELVDPKTDPPGRVREVLREYRVGV